MHVGWCAARPEGSEGGKGYGAREPDRKESSVGPGRAVRDDLLLVAWQPLLFSWQNSQILFNSIIMLLSETGRLPLCFGMIEINSLNGLEIVQSTRKARAGCCGYTQEVPTNLCPHFPGTGEGKKERGMG